MNTTLKLEMHQIVLFHRYYGRCLKSAVVVGLVIVMEYGGIVGPLPPILVVKIYDLA